MSTRTCSVISIVLSLILVTACPAVAQQPGITGKWTGVTVSSIGDKADLTLHLEEHQDGTISGTWDQGKIEKGERVTGEVARWEMTDGDWRYCYRCAIKGGGKALEIEITATKKESGKVTGYTATSLLTK